MIAVPPLLRSSNEEAVTVAGLIASSNVAVTLPVTGTPVAPLAGVVEVTRGARVSGGGVRSNFASTQ